jgi:hypothetical protein
LYRGGWFLEVFKLKLVLVLVWPDLARPLLTGGRYLEVAVSTGLTVVAHLSERSKNLMLLNLKLHKHIFKPVTECYIKLIIKKYFFCSSKRAIFGGNVARQLLRGHVTIYPMLQLLTISLLWHTLLKSGRTNSVSQVLVYSQYIIVDDNSDVL